MKNSGKKKFFKGNNKSACVSCGAYPAIGRDLCFECQHAVDIHGANRFDAHAIECDCDDLDSTFD